MARVIMGFVPVVLSEGRWSGKEEGYAKGIICKGRKAMCILLIRRKLCW